MFRKVKKHIAILLLCCFSIILSENPLHVFLLHDHSDVASTVHTCAYHHTPEQTDNPPADADYVIIAEAAKSCLRCDQFMASIIFQIAESHDISLAPAADALIQPAAKSPLKSNTDTRQDRGPPATIA